MHVKSSMIRIKSIQELIKIERLEKEKTNKHAQRTD